MFYHPTICPDCARKNPFGKVRCVKCYKRLYTDDLKPLPMSEQFPPTIHRPKARHDRYTRKLSVLKARQPALSRISSLTSMGTLTPIFWAIILQAYMGTPTLQFVRPSLKHLKEDSRLEGRTRTSTNLQHFCALGSLRSSVFGSQTRGLKQI